MASSLLLEEFGQRRDTIITIANPILVLVVVFLWLGSPMWVYGDAKALGTLNAPFWAVVAFVTWPVGAIAYVIARLNTAEDDADAHMP